MTKEQATKLLPVMQAFVNGETIQFLTLSYDNKDEWADSNGSDPDFQRFPDRWRVKPKTITIKRWSVLYPDGQHYSTHGWKEDAEMCAELHHRNDLVIVELVGTYTPQ